MLRRAVIVCVLAGCASHEPVLVNEPPPPRPVDPASLCTARDPIDAPPPRAVAGYPFFPKTLSKDEIAARANAAKSADWPHVQLDRFGMLEFAASRPRLVDASKPDGPTQIADAVRQFVDSHLDLFGGSAKDFATGWNAHPTETGAVAIQSFGHLDSLVARTLAGKSVPPPRPASELLAPWTGTQVVVQPLAEPRHPCDPVTPSGRECEQAEPTVPPPTLSSLGTRATKPTWVLRGEPPALRSVYVVELAPEEHPCRRVPHEIDAVTGEVIDWRAPAF